MVYNSLKFDCYIVSNNSRINSNLVMKSRIFLVFVHLILFETINLYSQHPSCEQISSEDVICDFELLHGISGTMNSEDSGGNQPNPLCPGTASVPNNITWYSFDAPEGGPYTITISFDNCVDTGTVTGVQIGIYTDCTFVESVFCEGSCTLDDVSIPSDVFIPGQNYFLFIDGCLNTVCDYEISIIGTFDTDAQLLGHTFIDYNADGIQNGLEPDLENVNITLKPGNQMTLTDSDGNFSFVEAPIDSFSITATMTEGEWEEDEIVIGISKFSSCDPIEIGFVPLPSAIPDALVSISNSIARCNLKTNFYITIQNLSSNTLDGTFEFTYDDLTSFVSSDIPGILFNGNTAIANTGELAPFEIKDYLVKLKMPAESDPLPELQFEITVFDNMQSSIADYTYSDQLRCSYDPNDKKEHPDRPGEDNLTLMDEDLEYKIRFQNNGNDTAFLVTIIDQLDPNIDVSSVRVVNSSHPVRTVIEESTLQFIFEDILLVDSTTNYDDSQGFVTFRCNAIEGIAENTIVTNQADIIFDLNSPIITNSTINTFVSELCTSDTVEIFTFICEGDDYLGYDSTGVYTTVDPTEFGCDSTTIINLMVSVHAVGSLSVEACQGEPILIFDTEYVFTESTEIIDTAYGPDGCIGTLTTIDVNVNSAQTIMLDTTVCEGEIVLINDTEYVFTESTEFIDTTFDADGCIDLLTTIKATVNPTQTFNIDTTICEGLSYLGLTVSGEYDLDSINEFGCIDTYSILLTVLPLSDPLCTVGTEDLSANEVNIYPNPARDQFFIEGENAIEVVSIYSINYQKVEEIIFAEGMQKVQMSAEKLKKGIYILAIKSEDRYIYKKLLVE